MTFVANAPVEHLDRHGLPFQADTSRCFKECVCLLVALEDFIKLGGFLYCIDLMPCVLLNCFPKLCSQLHCLAWSLHGGEGSECGNFREQILRVSACRSVQEDVYQKDNLQRCLTVFQDFDERLLKVLRETDPSTVTEHGLYERSPDKMPDEVIYPSSSARLEEAHRLC